MDLFKKPMTEKVLKKRFRREKLLEKELKNKFEHQENQGNKRDEWKKPPPGLTGKQKGLWYRERSLREKSLRAKAEGIPSNKTGKKVQIESNDNVRNQKIYLSKEIEQKMHTYLSSIQSIPPASLVSQLKVLQDGKKKLPGRNTENIDEPCCSKSFVMEEDNNSSTSSRITGGGDSQTDTDCISSSCVDEDNNKAAIDYWVYGGAVDTEEKQSVEISDSATLLSSVDKYKYLEDTTFKRRFLKNLTGTIEANLEQAMCRFKLNPDPIMDDSLKKAFFKKMQNPTYRNFVTTRSKLPSYRMRHLILDLMSSNQVILISGETGCGKTTQVAQFILDDALVNNQGSLCSILCTQPRRISAIAVANRVAQERCETVGQDSIGYQIRLERKVKRTCGAILFCTTGMLIQFMQSDPSLSKYSHIILDEIHERDTICDFALTIIRNIIVKRKDLKVILMSATLNAEHFSSYFDNCPMVNIPGYTFPVTEHYLEDIILFTKFTVDSKKKKPDKDFEASVMPYVRELRQRKSYPEFVLNYLSNPESEKINPDLIVALLKYICMGSDPGSVLIFLPGWEDINTLIKTMMNSGSFPEWHYLIIPLHSMMPTVNQQSVFDHPPPGVRKIIVATNIAETSITIDDVVFVIDCGKTKIKNFDVIANVSTLKPEWVSRANAKQRRGRAGRVQAGICYHMFSRGRERTLADYPLPEMLRTRLEEVVLNVKILQLGRVVPFLSKVMDPPNPVAVNLALELLIKLNALDENENLTPLGYHLAQLPLDPQIGKMLLVGTIMSCLDPVLSIAAILSFKDPFFYPLGNEKKVDEKKRELDYDHKSDHLMMAEVLNRWSEYEKCGKGKQFCRDFYLTRHTLFSLKDLKFQFAKYLCNMGFLHSNDYKSANLNMNSSNAALVKAVICAGLYPNVAIIKKKSRGNKINKFIVNTAEDGRVMIHPKSVNASPHGFNGNFLLYHEKLKSTNVFLHDTTMINALPMLFFGNGFNLTEKNGEILIDLKKGISFTCSKAVADLITELRFRLDWLFEYKLSHPGQIVWQDNNTDASLLRALVELLTYEDDKACEEKAELTSENEESTSESGI